MGQRVDLQAILENTIGSKNVYFQPPENLKLKYPCVVYAVDGAVIDYANNLPYIFTKRYQLTLIELDPDSGLADRLGRLPMCSFDRPYRASNLYHSVFTIYF